MLRRAIWMALLIPATAGAWPDDDEWSPLTRDGAPIADPGGELDGTGNERFEILGDASAPVASWFADSDEVFFRIRVAADPDPAADTEFGGWGFLLEQNGDPADQEYRFGFEAGSLDNVIAYQNVTGEDGVSAVFSYHGSYGSYGGGEVRVVEGDAVYIDFLLDRTDFASMGVSDTTPFRLAAFGGLVIPSSSDLAMCDELTETCEDLEPLLADALQIDSDGDGWTDPQESHMGADPNDADSDDDGLIDSLESAEDIDGDGVVGLVDCDSDADGIGDGVEAAVSVLDPDTNTESPCYQADVDTNSSTDPNEADSDGGGMPDGDEDWNFDGAVGDWETDPENAADDTDTDSDGIADALELELDPDGDLIGAKEDLDSDGDGINDAEEWLFDSDGDLTPDFLDDDSDDDGLLDSEEGDGDSDGDGTPDFRDEDSDGNGVTDGEEDPGDADCDGIPNWQDVDDNDGDCDTDAPPAVDTDGLDLDSDDDTVVWSGGDFTGGACGVVPVGVWATPTLLVAALVLGRRRRVAVGAAGVLLVAGEARAQDVNAQRFTPTIDGTRFAKIEDMAVAPKSTYGGGLSFNYADDPFVFRYADSDEELDILGRIGTIDAIGFYSLGRVRFGFDLPLHAYRHGFDLDGALVSDSAELGSFVGAMPFAIGDLRVSGKAQLTGGGAPVGAAVWLDGMLPTAPKEGWVGSGRVGVRTGVAVGASLGDGALLGNVGFRSGNGDEFGALAVAPAMMWGAGYGHDLTDRFGVAAEVDGELWLDDIAEPGAKPIEWLASTHVRPWRELMIVAGGGTGVTRGVGAPDYRVIGAVTWSPRHEPVDEVVGGDADPDHDGLSEGDVCPTQPEDPNGVADGDGCPDGGGLVATTFEVVTANGTPIAGARLDLVAGPETGSWLAVDGAVGRALPAGRYELVAKASGFAHVEAEAEIPAGVAAHSVRIALAPPDDVGHLVVRAVGPSGVQVSGAEVRILGTLGMPLKTGADGIFEADLIPGRYETAVAAPGWTAVTRTFEVTPAGTVDLTVYLEPTAVVIDTDSKQIFLHRKVFFELDRAELKVDSLGVLDDLVETLNQHPEIRKLRIEGHTDSQGSEHYNLELSRARAQAVVDYLVRQGVDRSRLVAQGLGEQRPLQSGDSDDVYATNRRVEFHIVEMER